MRVLVLAVLVFSISVYAELQNDILWKNYKIKHGKTYKNQVEEIKRYAIYQEHIRSIEEHNARFEKGLTSYKKGVNQFTDMTRDEYLAILTLQLNGKPTKTGNRTIFKSSTDDVPDSIDWRDSGIVTAIKDQGTCGACWAFSATGALEAAYAQKTGNLVSFSEQQIVDCSKVEPYGMAGCNGGFMEAAFDYVTDYGIQTETSYPYEGVDGSCRFSGEYVTKANGYIDLPEFEEDALVEAVGTIGPISVAIDANNLAEYASGIYDEPCSSFVLNHGVLAVGYGIENGQPYWLIKNSWGVSWGEEGYFKLKRGENQCGVAVEPSYPLL
ncbi:cathepsin L-like isoform X2 [Rhynchophorus ferrugineus]|uniref:Uncharacterized protein n=1 Tax=Rhynchophorus ferrugineus TaxID=354439 RepID=A0A834MC90_RHYFE|nr:hypothetical protein GWI33_008462 [Rhynchophorus ferrugineus]